MATCKKTPIKIDGSNAWQRIDVLTFDGNVKLKNKVTFKAIQTHLNKEYGRKFAYGTIIQLFVPRNKHRISSKRYGGILKLPPEDVEKGFLYAIIIIHIGVLHFIKA